MATTTDSAPQPAPVSGQPPRDHRAGRERPVGGFELWAWLFMRISGLVLLLLAVGLPVLVGGVVLLALLSPSTGTAPSRPATPPPCAQHWPPTCQRPAGPVAWQPSSNAYTGPAPCAQHWPPTCGGRSGRQPASQPAPQRQAGTYTGPAPCSTVWPPTCPRR